LYWGTWIERSASETWAYVREHSDGSGYEERMQNLYVLLWEL
jgi:hypothetical protein